MNCIKKMQWSLISNKWWRWSVSCLRWLWLSALCLSVCLSVTVSPYQLLRLIFYILTFPLEFLYTSKYSQFVRRIYCSIAKFFHQCSAQQRPFYSFILNQVSNEVSFAWLIRHRNSCFLYMFIGKVCYSFPRTTKDNK